MRRCKFLALVALMLVSVCPALADTLTIPYSFTAGDTITAAKFNSNYSTIATVVNGNLDDNNIKVGAGIATSKLNLTAEMPILRSASNRCVSAGVTGDTIPRVSLTSEGGVTFGAGSSSAHDLRIKREDANTIAIRDAGDTTYKNFKAAAAVFSSPLGVASGGTGLSSVGTSGQLLGSDGSGYTWVSNSSELPSLCNGRLTLTSGTAITTTDVTAATTVYFTPFGGNRIALYDGSATWATITFSEISASLSGLTANLPYDVFCYNNSGTATLELTAWTSSSARATALTTQNGVLVRSGATTRRYLGTILITASTGQCEDSAKFRGVYNFYNQVGRSLQCTDSTNTWTYASTTWRSFNNSTTLGTGAVRYIDGQGNVPLRAQALGVATDNALKYIGVGVNSTSSPSGLRSTFQQGSGSAPTYASGTASFNGVGALGTNTIYPLEATDGSASTFVGDNGGTQAQTGLSGSVVM